MENTKLIAITDSCHLKLYEAQGLKIIKGPTNVELPFTKHERSEKSHGSYDGASGHSVSASDPQTTPKEIDRQNAAKMICDYLDKLFEGKSAYKELIIAADPKMLGHLRKTIGKTLKKKVTIEISKDLLDESIESIEHAIFSA